MHSELAKISFGGFSSLATSTGRHGRGWVGPGYIWNFCICGKSSQNSPILGLLLWGTLLTYIIHNDLSVLSMSVMGFKKSLDREVDG